MPVLIRGIFSGGGKIKDATAVPSDVASGKVFYNNDGRQVGSGNSVKSFMFYPSKNTSNPQIVLDGRFSWCYFTSNKGLQCFDKTSQYNNGTLAWSVMDFPDDAETIIALERNNVRYYVAPLGSDDPYSQPFNGMIYSNFCIGIAFASKKVFSCVGTFEGSFDDTPIKFIYI